MSNRPQPYRYEIVQRTQHWRLIDGVWHRDAVARRSDGSTRLIALPERIAA